MYFLMADSIEIAVGDVTDVEARVIARYRGAEMEGVVLQGTVRGPFCAVARTLPADFEFRRVDSEDRDVVAAEALISDPCMWSAELPHLYDVDVEARQGEQVVAEYHGKIGLRRLAPRRPVDFAPGTG
jgi:beta-galactosidase/beta-glucuronidase